MYKVMLAVALSLTLALPAWGETLTLKECLSRAVSANLSLKAASYDERIAREQTQAARSGFLPRVDFQAGYQAQNEAQAAKLGAIVAQTQDADFAFLNLSLYSTLYDFGRTRSRVGAAQKQSDAARHSFSATEQDLFLQVVRAYYGILEARKLVQAADDEVAQMTSHQNTAQALFEQGVVTRNDLLQAEVRVAASRQKLFSAQNAAENGWLLLNYLVGAPPQARAELQEEAVPALAPATEAQPDFSKRGRSPPSKTRSPPGSSGSSRQEAITTPSCS